MKYGFKDVTLQEAAEHEIAELETLIKSKAEAGLGLATRVYSTLKLDLVGELEKHFKQEGFLVDIYKNKEILDFVVLIIGWDGKSRVDDKEEENIPENSEL